ncbi:aspartate aminotransferase family protein [Candidatus Bathyarchaeota archaeon]|nr:MAG: aspartate aminotransferase family protein [Candidatus Bathyarchaeota archaeon]
MVFTDQYIRLTPTSKKLYERAVKVFPSGNTRTVLFYKPYPAYVKRGRGSHIWDVDGNERIDYCFNYGVLILGHSHPKIIKTVKEQLENGLALGAPTELEVNLAEKIVEKVPSAEMVRFTASGTEAVMLAIRVARAYTGRDKILMFEGGFCGNYDAVSTSYTVGLPKQTYQNTIYVPFNNPEILEKTIKKHKNELAAVITEPVFGANGPIVPKGDFLKEVREITEKHDVLLIFDEVVTGFRLAPGGAAEFFGVKPDLVTFGKIMGGGFPAGAVCGRKELMNLFSFSESYFNKSWKTLLPHSGSFNAYPLAMAAGYVTLNELTPQAYEHLNTLGEKIRKSLTKISEEVGVTFQVSGVGSLFQIFFIDKEITDYKDVQKANDILAHKLNLGLLTQGVYFSPTRPCNISTVTSYEDVDKMLEAVRYVLTNLKKEIREISPNLISN